MSNHFQRDTTIGADSVYCRAIIFEVAPEGGPTTIVREWSTIEGFNPEGVVEGSPGDVRVRVDTGQIWLKQSGFNTTTGWVVVSTGGGGGGGASPCDDDPLPPAPVASPGTSPEFSRCDHVHPEQAVPDPSDADPLAPAAVADPGVSADYSRADHVHPEQAIPASPDPSDADPLPPAAVADPGVSAEYSRGDHVHPEQPVPNPSDADPLAPAAVADPGVSPDYSRSDHVHPEQAAPATPPLADVLVAGNTTDGTDIIVSNADALVLTDGAFDRGILDYLGTTIRLRTFTAAGVLAGTLTADALASPFLTWTGSAYLNHAQAQLYVGNNGGPPFILMRKSAGTANSIHLQSANITRLELVQEATTQDFLIGHRNAAGTPTFQTRFLNATGVWVWPGTFRTADNSLNDFLIEAGSVTVGAGSGRSVTLRTGAGGPAGGDGGVLELAPADAPSGLPGYVYINGQLVPGTPLDDVVSGTINNYSPFGLRTSSLLRLDAGPGTATITGLDTSSLTGRDRFIVIANVDAVDSIVLEHESLSSLAANRFSLPDGAPLTIGPGSVAWMWYDVGSTRWRAVTISTLSSAPPEQGAFITGLDAAYTGSTNTTVALFSPAAPTVRGSVPLADWLTYAANAADGSSFKFTQPGKYSAWFRLASSTGGVAGLWTGLSIDAAPARLSQDPNSFADPTVRDSAPAPGIPAGTGAALLVSITFTITPAMAASPTLGTLRAQVSNLSNAAPAAGTITASLVQLSIERLGDAS